MSWSIYAADGTLLEHGDDATRTVTTGTSTRPYTAAENAAADAALADAARLDGLNERVARIEAHLWPAPTTVPTTVPTWAELAGVWPAGGLVLDGGTVYRNISGVPLTTPPSGFPGSPSAWGHLFKTETAPTTPPEQPATPAWAEGVAYKVGDIVTFNGATYTCLQAHGSQAGWTPAAVPSLWNKN